MCRQFNQQQRANNTGKTENTIWSQYDCCSRASWGGGRSGQRKIVSKQTRFFVATHLQLIISNKNKQAAKWPEPMWSSKKKIRREEIHTSFQFTTYQWAQIRINCAGPEPRKRKAIWLNKHVNQFFKFHPGFVDAWVNNNHHWWPTRSL